MNAIRFQGQWQDEESGLYYNRHRYYDPKQGRYISQDPIGLKGGKNLYGYVSNPTGMVDPLGLEGVLAGTCRPDSRTLMGMRGSRPSSMNNGIIETCVKDVEEWMKVPDYSGAVNTRNSIMAVISRQPGAGFLAKFSEAATLQVVCSHMNDGGSLINEDTGEPIPNFEIWPGPVPEEAVFGRQSDIPGNPRATARKAIERVMRERTIPGE